MTRIMRTLSDFRMTTFAAGTGLVMLAAMFAMDTRDTESYAMPLLLLLSLLGFTGLFTDFHMLKKANADIARQQRDLILQTTLAAMADTTNNLRHDLQLLYREAEEGQLPDLEALRHLQHLLEVHVARLQQLGTITAFSDEQTTQTQGIGAAQFR